MSDTPKTDAVADDSWSGGVALVPYEFAQQQERRIAELEKALEEIEANCNGYGDIAGWACKRAAKALRPESSL